jgi:hypothetical protein
MTRVPTRTWSIAASALLVCAAAAATITSAHAATFTVTRSDDPAPGACDPADCSLREAVIAANGAPGADTVALPAGTYSLTIPDSTEPATGADATQGDLDVTDALTLQASGGPATIDAGARFSAGASAIAMAQSGTTARVLHVLSTSLTTTNVSVTGGSGDQGAGIQVEAGALTVNGGAVTRNVSNGTCCGGGIGALRSDVSLAGAEISNNAVTDCCGGGIYNESSTVSVNGGSIAENDAFGCCGAGVHNWTDPGAGRNAALALTNVLVNGNDVRDCCGGGIYNEDGSPVGVTITGSTFTNNHASDACCGGAVYSTRQATVSATGTVFMGSSTDACCGGAIYNEGTFSLTRGSIVNNAVASCCGGGLAAIADQSSTTLTNVTVSGNSAGVAQDPSLPSPGGLYLDSAGGQMTLTHGTVAANSGSNGASGIANGDIGVPAAGALTLARSIVAGNSGAPQCRGPITSQGHNIASDGSCSLTQPTDRPSTDPQLAPLGSGFHALLDGSPAIDAIPPAACPPPPIDQRGTARPQDRADAPGTGCDIGAVEMEGTSATPSPSTPPTATPTPLPTQTATPTPVPTQTPSPTPTASPSAPPTQTPTPTATATVTPSPTPTPEPIDPRCDDDGVICGTDGSETITGTEDGELIICGDGDDVVEADGGDDTIECGDEGDEGDKDVDAGGGDDDVRCGGTGDDEVDGGAGDDSVRCGAGKDELRGAKGRDRIVSTAGPDMLYGGAGRDVLVGGGGSDGLYGGARRDTLRAGRGDDTLLGEGGRDEFLGGPGHDGCDTGRRERERGCETWIRQVVR